MRVFDEKVAVGRGIREGLEDFFVSHDGEVLRA
jgi:hypothetical protein